MITNNLFSSDVSDGDARSIMTSTQSDEHVEKSPRSSHRAARYVGSAPSRVVSSQNVLLFLIAFRILNALSIKTFFQPDEYFQSLEPAWEMAFGKESGAWITWVRFPIRNMSESADVHVRNGDITSARRSTLLFLLAFIP